MAEGTEVHELGTAHEGITRGRVDYEKGKRIGGVQDGWIDELVGRSEEL